MSIERVKELNEFAGPKHPGMVGVEILTCTPAEVRGRLLVKDEFVAGTGYRRAPVVITLADWLCAAGTPQNMPSEATSFTTIELKTNFLGSARTGEEVSGVARPAHIGRTTQAWDVEITNETTSRRIALFRCTQMILYAPKTGA